MIGHLKRAKAALLGSVSYRAMMRLQTIYAIEQELRRRKVQRILKGK